MVKNYTLKEIIDMEPRISLVLTRAKQETDPELIWVNYSAYKNELIEYVGAYAENRELNSCISYNTVITALCDALRI